MNIIESCRTDIGPKRQTNQDSLAILKVNTPCGPLLLAVICDGMGGYSAGEEASRHCVDGLTRWFKTELPGILSGGAEDGSLSASGLHKTMEALLLQMNQELFDYQSAHNLRLGSTLTALLIIDRNFYIAQVGDSRCYYLTDKAYQLTRDQSVVAYEVEQGLLTPEQARCDRRLNQLRECMGITPTLNMEFISGEIHTPCTFLLCSDGLWHFLRKSEMVHYLSAEGISDSQELSLRLQFLIETVKQRGERDNISASAIVITE